MRSDCPQPEDVLLADGLEPDHPLRVHLDGCARCRTLLAARERFLAGADPADDEEAARLDDADRRLAAFISDVTAARTTSGGTGGPAAPTPPVAPPREREPGRFRGFAWPVGLAAALVVAAGSWLLLPRQEATSPGGSLPTLDQPWRGGGPDGRAGAAPTATVLRDGGWQLRWQPTTGADRYEVVVLAEDLTVLATLDAGGATELAVSPAALPAGPRAFFFAVTAYAGATEAGRWAPTRLP